jgi:hypothetical protein
MMLSLVPDISHGGIHPGNADAKCHRSPLATRRNAFSERFLATHLDEFPLRSCIALATDSVAGREREREREEHMHMIARSANGQRLHLILFRDATEIWP